MKEIVLAGGCFWGMEAYFKKIYGVSQVTSGYANGQGTPNYKDLCAGYFDHAEAEKILYDEEKNSSYYLICHFFRVVDPTTLHRQAADFGKQYRSGSYYTDALEKIWIKKLVALYARDFQKPLVVEVQPLENFYKAEEYHQDYLEKNPGGYCHIPLWLEGELFIPEKLYELFRAPPFLDFPEGHPPGLYVTEEGLPMYLSFQRRKDEFKGEPLVKVPDDELYFVPKEEMLSLGYGYLLPYIEKKSDLQNASEEKETL